MKATKSKTTESNNPKKRKAVTKKCRLCQPVPDTKDGAILIFCAYGCGLSYTTYPRDVNRLHWHKTLRKLNAHESQRCPRNSERKRSCRKNSKARASSTANDPRAVATLLANSKDKNKVVKQSVTKVIGKAYQPTMQTKQTSNGAQNQIQAKTRRGSDNLTTTATIFKPPLAKRANLRRRRSSLNRSYRHVTPIPVGEDHANMVIEIPENNLNQNDINNSADAVFVTAAKSASSKRLNVSRRRSSPLFLNINRRQLDSTAVDVGLKFDVDLEVRLLNDRISRDLTPDLSPVHSGMTLEGQFSKQSQAAATDRRTQISEAYHDIETDKQRRLALNEEGNRVESAMDFTRRVFPKHYAKIRERNRRHKQEIGGLDRILGSTSAESTSRSLGKSIFATATESTQRRRASRCLSDSSGKSIDHPVIFNLIQSQWENGQSPTNIESITVNEKLMPTGSHIMSTVHTAFASAEDLAAAEAELAQADDFTCLEKEEIPPIGENVEQEVSMWPFFDVLRDDAFHAFDTATVAQDMTVSISDVADGITPK